MARHQNTYNITKDMDYWIIAADEVLLYELENDFIYGTKIYWEIGETQTRRWKNSLKNEKEYRKV